MQLTAESVEYHAHADSPRPSRTPGAAQPGTPPPTQQQWGDDWKRG